MPRRYFLLFTLFFILPALVCAAGLVNINTADLATLETLNGIGPSKGQAIIDYRTQHGPFAAIEDIMNVSGIGTVTYNNIKAYITVSDTAPSQPQPQTQPATSTPSSPTATQTAVSSGGAGPPAISATITADTVTAAGAGTYFTGTTYGTNGEPLAGARYIWNFGDGATAEGADVLHTYVYPGVYDIELSVGYNYSSAIARLMITAKAPQVSLVLQSDDSLLVTDDTTQDLSIGGWSLVSGEHSFAIPPDTRVHAQGGVRFAPAVMGFAAQRGALLRFPNGAVAATATIAADSPLHGEPVTLKSAAAAPAAPAAAPAVQTPAQKAAAPAGQAAAVATAPAPREVAWSYMVGLAAVIALGAVGAYYAHTTSAAVTEPLAEEFDIE